MDMNVLMAAQLLMEQVAAENSGPLLYRLYQHLLFNFHLWTLSDFAVRLGTSQPGVRDWLGRVEGVWQGVDNLVLSTSDQDPALPWMSERKLSPPPPCAGRFGKGPCEEG